MELRRQVIVARLVDLVGDDQYRNRPAPQDLGNLRVPLTQAGASVDNQRGGVALVDRLARLPLHGEGERVPAAEVAPAGVDQLKARPVPLAGHGLTISRLASLFVPDS